MSKNTKTRFKRKLGERRYKKLFIISTEGKKTEPEYFHIFNNINSMISMKILRRDNKSSPQSVLKTMNRYLKEIDSQDGDEAWLVVDKDQWKDEQLQLLFNWSNEQSNYGLAVSNPKFEFWLLLHFEDGLGLGEKQWMASLKRYIPDYDKKNYIKIFSIDKIQGAVNRAKKIDDPPCEDWPKDQATTVYRLVEKLIY